MDPSPLLHSYNFELTTITDTSNDKNTHFHHAILTDSSTAEQINHKISSDDIGICQQSDPLTVNLKINDNYLPQSLAESKMVEFFISFKCNLYLMLLYVSILLILGVRTLKCIIFICETNRKVLPPFQLIFITNSVVRLLHVNRNIMYAVLNTFTFWFKLLCWFTFLVGCLVIQYRTVDIWIDWVTWVTIILILILLTLIFLTYAFLDGLNYHKLSKKCFLVSGSILMILNAVSLTIAEWDEPTDARIVHLPYIGCTIDILAYMAASMRTISLFVVKQTVCFFWKPNQAILIKNNVKINRLSGR
eukprot:433864_1